MQLADLKHGRRYVIADGPYQGYTGQYFGHISHHGSTDLGIPASVYLSHEPYRVAISVSTLGIIPCPPDAPALIPVPYPTTEAGPAWDMLCPDHPTTRFRARYHSGPDALSAANRHVCLEH